ncbi:MAG: putative sugar nucleotidyl transferase [Bacteroidia bacterium]|nr:putative sugar nucleotidyl transferase [Bacteroidia bacterium]
MILFEDGSYQDLLPFTFTRPVWALRCGILTPMERWTALLEEAPAGRATGSLAPIFGTPIAGSAPAVWINPRFLPEPDLLRLVQEAEPGCVYLNPRGEVLAACLPPDRIPPDRALFGPAQRAELGLRAVPLSLDPPAVRQLYDLFRLNRTFLEFDFALVTRAGRSEPVRDPHTIVYGADNLYLSPGVKLRAAVINAEDGPVYLGPGVELGEGTVVRNAHAFCAHSSSNLGSKFRGDSTIGPWAKAGGEVSNSVLMGYCNKGHDGFIGNSVLGYWTNLGAGTNTSNLKNTYAPVRLWHYPSRRFQDTGLQFCGLFMGDHSKSAINTMFNTGTVVGVSANVFGGGFPRNVVPSFSWGGYEGMKTYRLQDAFATAEAVMQRRGMAFSEAEQALLREVFEQTKGERTWEAGA